MSAWSRRIWLAVALLGVASFPVAGGGGPAVALVPGKTPKASIEVRGLAPEVMRELRRFSQHDLRWPRVLGVRVTAPNRADLPPMLGTYELTTDAIRFRPRFPLEPGIAYRVDFAWPSEREEHKASPTSKTAIRFSEIFEIPIARRGEPARVVAVYPSGGELPENLLRLYIQFSAPMSQGDAYRRVHLHDETAGSDVEQPFLELPQELWGSDGTRLTLLLEPGRVKHGLVPRDEVGPVLVAGHKYLFTVEAAWPDAEGRPLADAYGKSFRAVAAETKQLDPRSWIIEAPAAGSRGALRVRFPRPVDRAMLERVLRVEVVGAGNRSAAAMLDGAARVTDEEKCWQFEPRGPWAPGRYAVLFPKNLEDPSGNSVGRPFEVDLKQTPHPPNVPAVVRLEFKVSKGADSGVRAHPLLGLEHK